MGVKIFREISYFGPPCIYFSDTVVTLLKVYEDASEEMRVSLIPLFVNSQIMEETFSLSLMEPDEENSSWRNNDLAGQIKLQKQYTGRMEPGRLISSNTTDIKAELLRLNLRI